MKQIALLITLGGLAAFGTAQSFNIDMNFVGTNPASTYAGVGSAGTWNSADWGNSPPLALVGLNGAATAATLGWTSPQAGNTGGGGFSADDRPLMEDWFWDDITFSFANLLNGSYDVVLYASTVVDFFGTTSLGTTFTIDGSSQATSGGGWTGSHVLGQSYVRFSGISVTDGTLAILSETLQSSDGLAGIQLLYRGGDPVPEPATMSLMGIGAIAAWRKRRKLVS